MDLLQLHEVEIIFMANGATSFVDVGNVVLFVVIAVIIVGGIGFYVYYQSKK